MAIVAAQSVSHFFLEVVEDAKRSRGVDATDGATRYLVGAARPTSFTPTVGRARRSSDR